MSNAPSRPTGTDRAVWTPFLDRERPRFVAELESLLRIPSVSALPEHRADVEAAAAWVARRLQAAGLDGVAILPTGGHPVVTGHWLHAGDGAPTILVYGHFDVQPVDPVAEWTTPPFEPVVRNGAIYARGASDDKGNMLVPILALEAMLATTRRLPVNVKCFFEGQEEIGSPQLPDFLARERERFACDVVLSADGGQWSESHPALFLGMKGLAASEVHVQGPNQDLHSGLHGGGLQNPIHALVRLLDSMRAPDGKITVDGFYDAVRPLDAAERAQIARIPKDDDVYQQRLGLPALFGEPGWTTRERQWARPTLEINGIWGGFQGDGTKTVIPREAHAKITCRLVPHQEPQAINRLLADHVRRHAPPGVEVRFVPLQSQAEAYEVPADHWAHCAVAAVLREEYGTEPYHVRSGGSIPVCSLFRRALGADTVLFGFALPDERFHAPDEFFRLASFERGQRAWCRVLEELALARH
jgi:acetylornithine deacetylase/succinyl-diaminopimelate desuccinylase-like protein